MLATDIHDAPPAKVVTLDKQDEATRGAGKIYSARALYVQRGTAAALEHLDATIKLQTRRAEAFGYFDQFIAEVRKQGGAK